MSLRLARFELRAFGPFTGTVLELRDAPAGALHIICGPNEIGKSTAQRGIGDFLFGIPARSTDNQLHDYGEMRLAAVLLDEHGRRHELVRRKGSRSTLLGAGGEPVDERLLDGMLGGMTREVFESMFSITHESLVVGGKALLAADGDLGESLFSASLGATGLHELRAALGEQADALFRPRATSSLIFQARSRLEAAQARVREATLRAATFTDNERQLATVATERAQLAEQIRVRRAAQNTRGRLRAVVPLLAAREQIQSELVELADGVELLDDAAERRVRALEHAASSSGAVEDAKRRIKDLKERVGKLTGDSALLDRELAIKDLHGRLASVRESAGDLERQQGKLHTATGLARRALDQVRPDLALDEAEVLLLSDKQRAKVELALKRHAKLTALQEDAENAAREADELARQLTLRAQHLDAPPDTTALSAAISEAQADGHIEQRLGEAQSVLEDSRESLQAALRELALALDVDALRSMRPPGSAAVDQFAVQNDRLGERGRELVERRERLDAQRRELEANRARLALCRNVPTVADLVAARGERDAHWTRLRRCLEGEHGEAPSPEIFEGQIRHADELSDRLRDEADEVARCAQLTVHERRLEAEYQNLAADQEKLTQEQTDHGQQWIKAWSATGIEPLTPREMSDWLRDRRTVLERADALARQARTVKTLTRARDEHVQTLRVELGAIGFPTPAEATLRRLLTFAQTEVDDADAARSELAALLRDLREAQTTADRQHEKADEQRRALESWADDWAQLVAANGWPQDVDADNARQLLDAVEELGQQLRDMTQLTARVNGIQTRLSTFADDAAQVVGELAPELTSWPAQDAAAELARRLEKAVQTRNRRETLEGELDAAHEELAAARRAVDQSERDLQTLVDMAGVTTVEELPEAERRSARVAKLREQLPELERQITDAGQAPLPELIERAAGTDIDALDAQITETEHELTALEEQLAQLDVRLGELGSDRQAMQRMQGASEAAQLVEQAVAELRELVERYVQLYVAAWALSEAIDTYRKEHKDPLLRRADELFPKLTCGAFTGLEVSFDEADEPVLVGVRRSGDRVAVKVMSTGTREQLYLALRLASLERHVELHGPMPVILDDVVLHSDPKRKSAILSALADLGHHTQVIAFSHDPQVVALAQQAINPDLLTVHELGGAEITGARQPQILTADVHPIRSAQAA